VDELLFFLSGPSDRELYHCNDGHCFLAKMRCLGEAMCSGAEDLDGCDKITGGSTAQTTERTPTRTGLKKSTPQTQRQVNTISHPSTKPLTTSEATRARGSFLMWALASVVAISLLTVKQTSQWPHTRRSSISHQALNRRQLSVYNIVQCYRTANL